MNLLTDLKKGCEYEVTGALQKQSQIMTASGEGALRFLTEGPTTSPSLRR